MATKTAVFDASTVDFLVKEVVHLSLSSVTFIASIVPDFYQENDGDYTLLPVAPYQLDTLSWSQLCTLVTSRRKILVAARCILTGIDEQEQNHKDLF